MDTPVERREGNAPPTNPGSSNPVEPIKTSISNMFERRGAIAALQLVAALRKRRLPTLPKLCTPDPANPQKRIEVADALIIGRRIIESHGRRQGVTLIALFPEVAKGEPLAEIPFVEFRSYQQLIPEPVSGRTLLVPVGPLIEGHQLIFANAEESTQRELIGLALEAIYRPPTGESPVLKP